MPATYTQSASVPVQWDQGLVGEKKPQTASDGLCWNSCCISCPRCWSQAHLAAEETGCGVPGLEWFHVILRNDSVDGSWWRNKFSSQEIDIPTVSMHEWKAVYLHTSEQRRRYLQRKLRSVAQSVWLQHTTAARPTGTSTTSYHRA